MSFKSRFTLFVFVLWFVTAVLIACDKREGEFFPAPSSTSDALIIISGDANHRGVTQYDLNGGLISLITDFRSAGGNPRGLAAFDSSSFLVSLDNTDRIERVSRNGNVQSFPSSGLAGAIYDIDQSPTSGLYYAIESNGIEVYDSSGNHYATYRIATNVGGCNLNSPRSLDFHPNGDLVVANYNSGNINVYDVSTPSSPTCSSSNNLGNNPWGIVSHSNGKLYIATYGDDQVYETDADGSNPTVLWATDLSIINNPTDVIEMPGGDILVSGISTDSIERIKTTDGSRVGSTPFIRDTYSQYIYDMLIIRAE